MTPPAGYEVRPARAPDRSAIAEFTRDTFAWGDYIDDVWDKWLTEATGILVVAVDLAADRPVGVAHAAIPAPGEAWLEGARVHPNHRRRGLAHALNDALVEWAEAGGASIARLGVEVGNVAARGQVEARGFAAGGRFVYAWASARQGSPPSSPYALPEQAESTDEPSPAPRSAHPPGKLVEAPGAGSSPIRPIPPVDRLGVRLATTADLSLVRRLWEESDARTAAAGLAARGWRWWSFGEADLLAAVRTNGVLTDGRGTGVLEVQDDVVQLQWLDGPGAELVAVASRQTAYATGRSDVLAIVPATGENARALASAGFVDLTPMLVYERALGVVA